MDNYFFYCSGILLSLVILRHIFIKKKVNVKVLNLFVLFIVIFSLIFLIKETFYFISLDFKKILTSFNNYFFFIAIFNFSIFLFCLSIYLLILNITVLDIKEFKFISPPLKQRKLGDIKIGKIVGKHLIRKHFFLSLKDLEKHMFICGSSGTGKSTFLQYFLINLQKKHDIPFLLVEFKGEYHFLQEKIKNLLVLWPGENFSINLFDPKDADPIIHAERIFEILRSGQFLDESSEFTPQMEKVLIEIIVETCSHPETRNWKGFEMCCKKYLKLKQNEIPMLKQTLISVKNRIRRFSEGPLKAIFDSNKIIDISDIFNRHVILDLSSIIRLGGDKKDALFFLNMILKFLWDKNLTFGARNYDGIKHITIIEDAQYFAGQELLRKSAITTYLEDIALLQRGTGECLITIATRPNISKEILANNGIVITFKNHIEKDIMCELLNLEEEKKRYLSFLEEGFCIIRINSIKDPFLLEIPLVKREILTFNQIRSKNEMIINDLTVEKDKQNKYYHRKENIIVRFFEKTKNSIMRVFNFKINDSNFKKSYENLKTREKSTDLIEPQISENLHYNKSSEKDFENFIAFIEEFYKKFENNKF